MDRCAGSDGGGGGGGGFVQYGVKQATSQHARCNGCLAHNRLAPPGESVGVQEMGEADDIRL